MGSVRNGIMQIVVLIVRSPTDGPDALQRFLSPNVTSQLVLDSKRLDGKTTVIHWTDKVERNRRGCV